LGPGEKSEKGSEQNTRSVKHLKNPIFAMMDLVEESMHTIPELVRLLRFSTYFITIMLVLLFLWISATLTLERYTLFSMSIIELLLSGLIIIIFIPTIIFLIDSETLFMYLQTRHNIIDSVRFEKDLRVPEGESQLDRLIKYLVENDPYIKSSTIAKVGEFKKDESIPGRSGQDYKFNAFFSSVNILKTRSASLGMPMGVFGVFIKVYKSEISLKTLQELRRAVLDVCEKHNIFPLRVIAFQWEVGELSDQAYNYIFENPIQLKNTLTHLEVAAEDGEVYSFIPIISYGKEM
jgi:hypothetical protein